MLGGWQWLTADLDHSHGRCRRLTAERGGGGGGGRERERKREREREISMYDMHTCMYGVWRYAHSEITSLGQNSGDLLTIVNA